MDMSLCMINWGIIFDIVQLYKVVKLYWDWNGKWMNRWMKLDNVWYELYVMHRHSVFRKENICAEK